MIVLEIANNRILNRDTLYHIPVADGNYVVFFKRINEQRTIRDYQEQYFLLVDEVVKLTGNSKYAIHDSFKASQDIETTKGFSIEEWIKFIEDFKWYCFENMEVLI